MAEENENIIKIDGVKAVEIIYQEYLIQNPDDHYLSWDRWDEVPGQIKNLLQFVFYAGFGYCNHILQNEGQTASTGS